MELNILFVNFLIATCSGIVLVTQDGTGPKADYECQPKVPNVDCSNAVPASCCNFINKNFTPYNNGLNTSQLLSSFNINNQVYSISTSQGNILVIIRANNGNPTKGPVFLNHGLLGNSDDWFLNDLATGNTLVQFLIEAGYDVFLHNSRGNKYSSATTPNAPVPSTSSDYWNFSWHELGTQDVPQVLKFILNLTSYKKLAYIGHSMGGTQYLVGMSQPNNPDGTSNNDLISIGILYAPAGFMKCVGGLLGVAANLAGSESGLLGTGKFSLPNGLQTGLLSSLCSNSVGSTICASVVFSLMGFNFKNTNCTQLPYALAHYPDAASRRQIMHYAQEVSSHYFRQYDQRLTPLTGSPPPSYNLKQITAHTAFFSGGQDLLAPVQDVQFAISNMNYDIVVNNIIYDDYDHLDWVWGIDAPTRVYPQTLDLIKQYPPVPMP